MKKIVQWIMLTAGILLLASCKPQGNVGPIELPENQFTPTPIVVPTCTPAEEPTQAVSPSPTAAVTPLVETPTPTTMEEPVLKPTAVPTPEPSATPTATPAIEVTPTELVEPTATPTLEPTATQAVEPTTEPTETPVPTEAVPSPTSTPVPTATPMPTATPLPTATPTPAVNLELLVNNGWQKTLSFDEKYFIIFPEMFRDSYLSRTDTKLEIGYSSPEEEKVEFVISYRMNWTLEEAVEEILAAGGIVEEIPEENRVSYRLYTKGKRQRGILIEEQYATELLGTTFGEEEFVTGVMDVMFGYSDEWSGDFWSEEYEYYVIKNREEN